MNPSEELLPYSAAQQHNRMLLEGSELDDDNDDGFTRKNGGGGGGYMAQPSLMMGRGKPLIEEESPEPESQPYFMRRPKANAARQIYDSQQAAKNPWKRGMPYSQTTLDTFDTSSPYEKKMFGGIQNPRQAANLAANRPGGFQKLFGAKMSANEKVQRELAGRAPKKTFWQRLKHAVTGGGRKRSWMEMFFGARRRGQGTSAASMGITSTNAPNGVSSGWADQLIDASKAGRLDEHYDNKAPFISDQPLVAQDQHQSAQHFDADASIEEEEKQPGGINLYQKQLAQQQLLQNAHMSNEYGVGQQNQYGDGDTVDDNSIDNDDDNDLGNGAGSGMFANDGYNKSMVDAYMNNNNDDDSEDEDGDPGFSSFTRNLIVGQLRQMQ